MLGLPYRKPNGKFICNVSNQTPMPYLLKISYLNYFPFMEHGLITDNSRRSLRKEG